MSSPTSSTKRARPILFSAPMVRAILAGRKTMTRRVVKSAPADADTCERQVNLFTNRQFFRWGLPGKMSAGFECPYGQPGDRLWVRETWGGDDMCGVAYRADHPDWKRFQGDGEQPDSPWRSPRFMPRWASRITLDVTGVRVERLQDISEEDARAEGCECRSDLAWRGDPDDAVAHGYRADFRRLWDSINAKRAPWASNPWVWIVEFKRVEVPRG